MITDPQFYALAVPAVIFVGLAKGGFVGALAVLGVPLMALVISPVQAAGILLPILIAMDVFALWAYRGVYDFPNLKIVVPAAILGIAIGWATAAFVSPAHVKIIVGIVAAMFTLDYWIGWRGEKQPGASVPKGGFWGMVAGFTSFVSHAGGPPLHMYLLPQRLEPRVFVGTGVIFFAVINWIKVIPYAALGQLDTTNLTTSAVLAPLAPLSIFAGAYLVKVLKAETFYRIAYLAIFIVALKLIWDGSGTVFGL
ncbi:MAG: sulfite exporter TauE/SafE family protein [Hyphomicrobiales bacterium]|nr:sulfite exporter TauE/SafE family protein [Hyphomicrobiales bacterium]